MSEIIDVLTILPDESPYFIVDTSQKAVQLKNPISNNIHMKSAGGQSYFQPGDNFTIISAGYTFPESFCLSTARANGMQTVPALNYFLQSSMSYKRYLPNFGLAGIQIPLENYELPLGVYVNVWDMAPPTYEFRTLHFRLYGILRGLDETGASLNYYDPLMSTPPNPVIGDVYFSVRTASGWTINHYYLWNGTTWDDVTGVSGKNVLPYVSMVGVPSSLNGEKIRVNVFTKILHNKPLLLDNPEIEG